jgi:hypothetical protein
MEEKTERRNKNIPIPQKIKIDSDVILLREIAALLQKELGLYPAIYLESTSASYLKSKIKEALDLIINQ